MSTLEPSGNGRVKTPFPLDFWDAKEPCSRPAPPRTISGVRSSGPRSRRWRWSDWPRHLARLLHAQDLG